MAWCQTLKEPSVCVPVHKLHFIVFNFRASPKAGLDYSPGPSEFAQAYQHHIKYVLDQIFPFDSISPSNMFSFCFVMDTCGSNQHLL